MSQERSPYCTPELTPLPSSIANRPPGEHRRPPTCPELAGHAVANLVERYGSPLVVIDEGALRGAFRKMLETFRARWQQTRISYSVKTNYLSTLVAIFREEGALGEVVSGFEYGLCRDLGIPGSEIIFNGAWKTDVELRTALEEGAMLNLDGDSELFRVTRLARDLDRPAGIGMRLNMELNYPPWDKFGFNLETGHALEAARLLSREPNLRLEGLHMHLGTYIPDPAMYGKAMEAVVAFATRVERELDVEIKHLDLGGGYATRNTLHGSFLPGEAVVADLEAYAEAVTAPLRMAASQFKSPPRLTLEPGRVLVDEAVSTVTTVRAVKRVSGQQKAAVVDCGVHILPTAFWYHHEFSPVVDRGQGMENYRMVGPLCMQIDVLRPVVNLPALEVGDLLVIHDTGAYNFSQSMQFIFLRPTYVLLHGDEVSVARLPEEATSVRSPERLPAHLLNAETRNSFLARPSEAPSCQEGRP